jgi:IS5 family transposase
MAVDTTVQPKAIAHPTDARLTHRGIEKLVAFAKQRQSYLRFAKRAAIMCAWILASIAPSPNEEPA